MTHTGGLCTVSINLFDPGTNTKSVSLGHTTGAGPTTGAGSTMRAGSTTGVLTEGPTALPPPTSYTVTVGMLVIEDEVPRPALAEAATGESCHTGLYKNRVT